VEKSAEPFLFSKSQKSAAHSSRTQYERIYWVFVIENKMKKHYTNFMDNKKGTIILTSTGLSADAVRQAAEKYFSVLPHKSVAIVTTAAEGKENNKYSKLAESQFKDTGFSVLILLISKITRELTFPNTA